MALPKSWPILAVVAVTLAWVAVLYCFMSSPPTIEAEPGSSSGSKRTSLEYLRSRGKATFWEQEDAVQLDGLIGEVVEELQKAKNETSSSTTTATRIEAGYQKTENPSPTCARTPKLLPVGQSLHSLVLHSVSRVSITELRLLGLVSVQLRQRNGDPVHGCAWVPRAGLQAALTLATRNESSVVWGSTVASYVNESQPVVVYDLAGIRCTFQDPVGADAEGGVLVLSVTSSSSYGPERYELVSVFEEKPEQLTGIQLEGPFKYEYAYCSAPVRNASSKFVKEWLMYHQSVWDGKVHYFIYDVGGVDPSLMKVFQPLLDAGVLTVVDMKQEGLEFEPVVHQLAISDCLQRSRFLATWAMFWDFDEYLQLLDSKVGSLSGLLRRFESKPWVSLGTILWSRTYCDYEKGDDRRWAVERMSFRLRLPTCMNESRADICHGVEGQRKWLANPREVFMGSVHRTLEPEWNGEILDAKLARLNHFHELALDESSRAKNCWILKNVEEHNDSDVVDGWWWKDRSFARQARQARLSSASLWV